MYILYHIFFKKSKRFFKLKTRRSYFDILRCSTFELLPYMAGEEGTRTHNLRLGMLNQKRFIAVTAFIP